MVCPYIPEIEYSDFRARISQKVAGQRIPLVGSLELTFRCNLRCQHCYVAHGHQGIRGQEELSYSEITRIIDEIAAEGCLWLLLTGGEPLMRPDFVDIYTYAKRKGMLVTLFTNGTMITPRLADYLVEYRPFNLEISLYGYTQETYERVTGIPGSHARCMGGIELLVERGIPLRLKTVVMTLNKHELGEMQDFAKGLGVEFRYDTMINSGIDGNGRPRQLRISPQEVLEIDRQRPGFGEELRSLFSTQTERLPEEPFLYVCGAGVRSFHIDPYGKLSLCLMSRRLTYDLRTGSFHQGWSEYLAGVRYQKPRGDYFCGRCELLPICDQCPGWAEFEHGEPQKPVDFLCQGAHLRAEAYNLLEKQQELILADNLDSKEIRHEIE